MQLLIKAGVLEVQDLEMKSFLFLKRGESLLFVLMIGSLRRTLRSCRETLPGQ